MNCHHALESLLAENLGGGEAVMDANLVSHLRGCDRCRRVAGALRADTVAFAAALATERVAPSSMAGRFASRGRAHRSVRLGALPGFVGAGVVLMLAIVWWSPQGRRPSLESARREADNMLPSLRPVITTAPERGRIGMSPPTVRRAPTPRPRRSAASGPVLGRDLGRDVVPFQARRIDPVPVAAVGVTAWPVTSVDVAGSTRPRDVIVTQHPGVRALVARTADPGITVVWLY